VTDSFRARFRTAVGVEPAVVASAPGRVNLIGEHTDYNGGEVLPIAIAARTRIGFAPTADGALTCHSASKPEAGRVDLAAPRRSGRWWDYIAGVVTQLRTSGVTVPAGLLYLESDVPTASGLSSSAALELAAALALTRAAGAPASTRDLALLCQRAEREFVGVASGIMDQFASGLSREGHALHLWCDRVEVEHVPIRDHILIFDTAVPRSLVTSAYNDRQRECAEALRLLQAGRPGLTWLAHATPEDLDAAHLPSPLAERARHVIEETRRVGAVVAALRGNAELPGELMLASHESLRTLYACSSPELDWFVERVMREPGVRGARLTGAGWGGCAIAAGTAEALREAGARVARDYAVRFRRTPRTWLARAEPGARVEASL
jgi:galactokinase